MNTTVLSVNMRKQPLANGKNLGPHQIYRDPQISIQNRQLGDIAPNEVRVNMIYAGICGTDAHLLEHDAETGYILSSAPLDVPQEGRVIGHEGIGRVIAIGSNVQHVKVGAYVTFESIIVCYYCEECRKGLFNQCRNAKLLGLEQDGIFSTTVDIPASLTHDVTPLIKNDKDMIAMACVEPAAVAYVACQNGKVAGGDSTVIFGAGPIGLFTAYLSKNIFGSSEVHIVEPNSERRKIAKKWCENVYDVEDFFQSCPASIDVVIEASGELNNVTKIFSNINANGRIVMLARSGKPIQLNAIDHMITNAITIIGSRGHLGGAFPDILNLYQNGRLPLNEIVTCIVDGIEGLYDVLNSGNKIINQNCKVLTRLSTPFHPNPDLKNKR